jgi:hypothetical protein
VSFEREIDDLYQRPLDEFTSARDELVKQLRAEGEREAAAQVKAMRKPTVAVWLVNRLAREDEVGVQRLLKAGDTLAKSQAKVAAGSSSDEFVDARRDEQQALDRLAREAREIAEREGIGAAAVERATQTLRAASLSDEGRELLKRGRLTEELEPPGFEALTGMTFAAPKLPAKKAAPKASRRRELEQAREALKAARAEERELSRAARSAEEQAGRLRQQADEAAKRVTAAEAALERLK